MSKLTYRTLLTPPLHGLPTLATIKDAPASTPCSQCRALVPDRKSVSQRNVICTAFEVVDTFPGFPGLDASAGTGCQFCALLRAVALAPFPRVYPSFSETDTGAVVVVDRIEGKRNTDGEEDETTYGALLDTEWDGGMSFSDAQFRFSPFGSYQFAPRIGSLSDSLEGDSAQDDGAITGLNLVFGTTKEEILDAEGERMAGRLVRDLKFEVYDSVDLNSTIPGARRNIPSADALSERNVSLVKDWIHECKENHGGSCQLTGSWTPSRILDVGSEGEDTIRLVEGTTAQSSDYAALTYVWGIDVHPDLVLRTLEDSIEERMEGIEVKELAPTFRDAVHTCRTLGIQYLWIDVLCVIQDSIEDWEKEAQDVSKIFSNASVTIAGVTKSVQCSFLRRNIEGRPAIKLSYEVPEGEPDRYLIISPLERDGEGTRESDIVASSWNTRAWTAIERAASSRIVFFCNNKIYFACRRAKHSETNNIETSNALDVDFWPLADEDNDKETMRRFYYQQWQAHLTRLTERKQRRPQDRLFMANTMASLMQQAVADEYLSKAGMWRRNLAEDLLWFVDEGPGRRIRHAKSPTWSWAGLDSAIGFVRGTTEYELPKKLAKQRFEVVGVSGEDEPPVLELKGYCKPLSSITDLDSEDEWTKEMRKEYPWDLHASAPEGSEEESVLFAQGALDLENVDEIVDSGKSFLYLHINSAVHPTGLILVGDTDGIFKRAGVATIVDVGADVILDPPFEKKNFISLSIR